MPVINESDCPSHEEIVAFSTGKVTETVLETISEHLETCESCISVLLAVQDSDDSLVDGLRTPSSGEQFLDEPEYQRAVEGVEAIGCGPLTLDRPDGGSLRPLPSEFGRYEILEELGQGGMGTVYLARDTQLGREVALKIPHFRRSQNPHLLERFYREARAAATIDDPNLCPVYDVGEIDGIPYLTMARIRGKSLSKVLKAKQFSDRETAQIVQRVALAVEKAHAYGIVHRDIKPSNIMITEEGEPILTDFGLAQRLELEDPRLTRSGVIVGTPSYMAPEQVDGDPETLGPACDIYSLGVVLYELLTGRAPFEGPLLSVLSRLGKDHPDPPSSHCPDVDRRLEAICLKAIAKAPANRYQSAGALAEALDQYLAGPPHSASPPSRRRRLIWGSAAGAALLLVFAAVITVVTNRGTLEIRTFDEDVKVSVLKNGQTVEIVDTKTKKTVILHAGRYELRLSDGKPGLWLSTNKFALRRGDRIIVEVRASTDARDSGGLARGGILRPEMFTKRVPVLMDPPWEYHGTYDPAKPCVTADGKWLSFKRYLPFKVHTAEWNESAESWGNVTRFPGQAQSWCGGSHIYIDPDTHERKWLFYGGSGGAAADIYRSSWSGGRWEKGLPITVEVRLVAAVYNPFKTADQPYFDGSRLYFHASNNQPDRNSIDLYYSDYDPGTDTFGTPAPIDPVDDNEGVNVAGYWDEQPSLSADGQTLFWVSNRPGGKGGPDIWMANWDWESDSWGVPVNLGPQINTAGDESYPSFNGARNSLYFVNRDHILVESKVIPELAGRQRRPASGRDQSPKTPDLKEK